MLRQHLGQYSTPPEGQKEVAERVHQEWDKIPAADCQMLIDSMPRRFATVTKSQDGHGKY